MSGARLSNNASGTLRWGTSKPPFWVDGGELTAPALDTALVTKTVTKGKEGKVFGVHISTPEANAFRLNIGTTVSKRFDLPVGGTVEVVLAAPLEDDIPGETVITISNITAGGGGAVYQASLLYSEE
jgi:hypothetical protein